MARIKEYPSITSFDGTNDALAIEQTDGANNRLRKVSPAQLKQYILSDSSKSSANNITIQRMGKVRVLTFNRAVYSDIKTFFANLDSSDKPSVLQFSTVMRTSPDDKYMTLAFVYASASGGLFIRHFAQYNANTIEGQIGETDKAIGELVYIVD